MNKEHGPPPPRQDEKNGRRLRRRAENLLKQKRPAPTGQEAADLQSMIHELQVHQIELELQNQELQQAHLETELARHKYFTLYDLAPVGYATFGENGEILEINLTGAQLLGQERKFLINRRFQLFIAPENIPNFNRFNQSVFLSGSKQSCELTLVNNGNRLAEVRLEAILVESGEGERPLCQVALLDLTEQRQAGRAVRESQERYQALVQASPDVIFETDAQGNNTFISAPWLEWTGMTPEETAGLGWVRALPPGEAELEEARWKEVVHTGEFRTYRHRLRNADGSYRWVKVRALPTLNGKGQIVRWTGALTDIDDEIQTQEVLRIREGELNLLLNAVPALIAHLDRDCRYRRVNRNYAWWFGFTAEEIQGRHISEVLGSAQWGQIKSQVEKVLAGETITYERQLPFQGGESRWVRASFTPEVNEAGRIQGFVVHVMDIEEGKKIEEAVRASEERYRRILETANEGIVIGSLDGKMIFINQKWTEMLGYSREEIIGRVGLEFMDQDQEAAVLSTRQELLTGDKINREFKFRRKDGSELWTLSSSSLLRDAGGNAVGFLGMHADITDRKQAERALRESRDDLNWAQAVAHTGSWRLNVQKNELAWSEESHRIFGILPGTSLTYETFLEIVHPEDRSYVDRKWKAALGGNLYDVEHRIVVEGRTRWVRELAELEFDEKGGLLGGFGTTQDITERKAAEEEIKAAKDELEIRVQERTAQLEKANQHLAEQSRVLESFFKDTITPLVLMDRDFNFIRVNEAYARACQRAVADFPGHNHFEFFPHEENEAIFRRVVETGVPYQALAKPFYFPDHPEWGVTYWDYILTPLPDDQGEKAFLVYSLEEVTDRQAAEEAVRKSERELRTLADQLLYAQENERKKIARDMHDSLGASLSALKYKMEDLIHHLPDRDHRQIGETLDSLIPIIQDTIAETRRMQNDLRPPLLDDLGILPTLTWFSREFQKIYSGIVIERQLEVQEEEVPDRLKVVIFRITQEALNNIGKHARATRAGICLGRERERLKLVIWDNGVGVDTQGLREPADQPTGMGLSSMKERAELSGGLYSLKTRPGQGTSVEVSWPLNNKFEGEHQADRSLIY